MTTQMYPTEPLQFHVNAPVPQHSRLSPSSPYVDDWTNYQSYGSSHEDSGSSTFMIMNNYPPNDNISLSPFLMQPRSLSSLPQLSPATSDSSLSPLYHTSTLSTPTTPASASQSFLPSPTSSQEDHMRQQESQVSALDVCHIYLSILFSLKFMFIA